MEEASPESCAERLRATDYRSNPEKLLLAEELMTIAYSVLKFLEREGTLKPTQVEAFDAYLAGRGLPLRLARARGVTRERIRQRKEETIQLLRREDIIHLFKGFEEYLFQ